MSDCASCPSRALRMLRVCAFVRASKGLPGPPHARETSGNVCRHCIPPERDPERDPEGTWTGEIVLLRIPERALPTTWLLKNIVLNLTPKLAPAFSTSLQGRSFIKHLLPHARWCAHARAPPRARHVQNQVTSYPWRVSISVTRRSCPRQVCAPPSGVSYS